MFSASRSPRIYLDHASTSWPKPPGVLEAAVEYQRNFGASAGRGAYRSSQVAGRIVESARTRVAQLIGAANPNEIGLLNNGTQALNFVLAGLLRTGDHVVTTAIEHNSVLRPLEMLRRTRGIEYSIVKCDSFGSVDPSEIQSAMRPNTCLVAVSHASNVTGAVQPVDSIAKVAHNFGALLLVDAAQTLGYERIDVVAQGIDLLAAPGHKGACAMLGTGLLYIAQSFAERIDPPWIGGTGTDSDNLEGPFEWPRVAEAGNLNVPAIASLDAGLQWLESNAQSSVSGLTEIGLCGSGQLNELVRLFIEEISQLTSFRIIGPDMHASRAPVVSVLSELGSPHELAAILDSSFGIEARAGLHCAGRIHASIGTLQSGGTLRVSFGHTSTLSDVEQALTAFKQLN